MSVWLFIVDPMSRYSRHTWLLMVSTRKPCCVFCRTSRWHAWHTRLGTFCPALMTAVRNPSERRMNLGQQKTCQTMWCWWQSQWEIGHSCLLWLNLRLQQVSLVWLAHVRPSLLQKYWLLSRLQHNSLQLHRAVLLHAMLCCSDVADIVMTILMLQIML